MQFFKDFNWWEWVLLVLFIYYMIWAIGYASAHGTLF